MATKKKKTSKSSGNDVVGINLDGISKMKLAIDDYVKYIKKEVNMIVSQSNINKGIKGSNSVNTLKQLSNEIDLKIESYVNGLNQFSSQLELLKSQYSKSDQDNVSFSSERQKIKNAE